MKKLTIIISLCLSFVISNSLTAQQTNQAPTPRPHKDITPYATIPFFQTNEDGIVISTDDITKGSIPEFLNVKDNKRMFTIQDKFRNQYKIKDIIKKLDGEDLTFTNIGTHIHLYDKYLNMTNFGIIY